MKFCQEHGQQKSVVAMLPSEKHLNIIAALFKALGDPSRMALLFALKDGERCVGDLVDDRNKLSTVSARLKVLFDANLVVRRRDARHLYYRLADQHVVELIENALAHADEEMKASV
ncbi:ArsR/SmtB family transcription factor [Vreelandella andesensis]|uniref:ArsR/SmtB family transcription factor n=1 Tax=Vreelandella andesensis TaxID=447567 RepID=UPI001ABF3602|nr:metalloregulator ArsR/SmtB family transcription factor [Halomonas andesensis]